MTALRDEVTTDPLVNGYWFLLGELRAELARRRIYQSTIAPVLRLSQPEISARLSGRVAFKYLELMRLAEALDLSMADLARWSEGPEGSRSVTRQYRHGLRAIA